MKVGPLLGLVITIQAPPRLKPGSKETRARGFLTSTLTKKHKGTYCKGSFQKRFSGFYPLRGGVTPLSAKLF